MQSPGNPKQNLFDTCDCLYNFVRRPNIVAMYKDCRLQHILEQRWSGYLNQLQIITADFDDNICLLEFFSECHECTADIHIQQILLLSSPANLLMQ